VKITLDTIGQKALIYCNTASRVALASSPAGEVSGFTEEQVHALDIMATVMEKELFELCQLYMDQQQKERNERSNCRED